MVELQHCEACQSDKW